MKKKHSRYFDFRQFWTWNTLTERFSSHRRVLGADWSGGKAALRPPKREGGRREGLKEKWLGGTFCLQNDPDLGVGFILAPILIKNAHFRRKKFLRWLAHLCNRSRGQFWLANHTPYSLLCYRKTTKICLKSVLNTFKKMNLLFGRVLGGYLVF